MIFQLPDAGEQPSLAPASQLEGSGAMSMPQASPFPHTSHILTFSRTLLTALPTAPSTDPLHRSRVSPDGPRWPRPFPWSPARMPQPKTRQLEAVAARRTIALQRVAVWVGHSRSRTAFNRLWVPEAAKKLWEAAAAASPPPLMG